MIQAIVFFPLIGALIAGLFGRRIGHRASEYVTSGLFGRSGFIVMDHFLPGRVWWRSG